MVRRIATTAVLLAVWMGISRPANAQFTFEADWLFFTKDNQQSSPFISGPNAVSSGQTPDYDGGYRLALFGGGAAWEIEAMYSQVDGFGARSGATLTEALVFDDTANNLIVFPGGPANTFSFATALFDASTNPNALGQDETLESEFLQPGAVVQLFSGARYDDFELNFGTNREQQWWRAAVGWRNLRFDENTLLAARGTFDALDVDDGAVFGDPTNDPNDALSHDALTEAGYSVLSGSGNGFDAADVIGAGPDTLTTIFAGAAHNELNGIQGVLSGRWFPGEWMTLEGIFKAGIYHNSAEGRVVETLAGSVNDDSIYRRTFRDRKTTASFVGTLGLRGLFPVTDYINFVAGYEATLLTGVALGTEQFHGVQTNLLGAQTFSANASDSAILHGGHTGLQITW